MLAAAITWAAIFASAPAGAGGVPLTFSGRPAAAGAVHGGETGNGWPAASAFIGPVCGLAVTGDGSLLISEGAYVPEKAGAIGRNRIRVVAAGATNWP